MALNLNIPGFQEDEYYKKTQQDLYKFGQEGLSGKFDPYYSKIGEYGGQQLEDLIGMGKRDITTAVTEDAAARRTGGGGRSASAIAKATGDMTTKLRWQDFLRGMQGRESLLGTSLNTMSGVRSAGQNQQAQKNQYEQWSTGLKTEIESQNQREEEAEKARKASMWQKIISGGLQLGGTLLGAATAGPGGAVTGNKLGSAVASSFTTPTMDYGNLPYSVRR